MVQQMFVDLLFFLPPCSYTDDILSISGMYCAIGEHLFSILSHFLGEGLGSVCDVTKVSIHIVFSVLVYFVYMEGEDFSFFSSSFEFALIFINTKSQQSCQYSPALCTSIIKQKSLLNAIPRLNQFHCNI